MLSFFAKFRKRSAVVSFSVVWETSSRSFRPSRARSARSRELLISAMSSSSTGAFEMLGEEGRSRTTLFRVDKVCDEVGSLEPVEGRAFVSGLCAKSQLRPGRRGSKCMKTQPVRSNKVGQERMRRTMTAIEMHARVQQSWRAQMVMRGSSKKPSRGRHVSVWAQRWERSGIGAIATVKIVVWAAGIPVCPTDCARSWSGGGPRAMNQGCSGFRRARGDVCWRRSGTETPCPAYIGI